MKVYHVNLGIRLDTNEVPVVLTSSTKRGLAVFGTIAAIIAYRTLTLPLTLAAKIIIIGWLAVMAAGAVYKIYEAQREYQNISRNYRKLVETARKTEPAHAIYGSYYVDTSSKHKEEYMRWSAFKGKLQRIVLWDKIAMLPAVKVGKHYVVFLPRGNNRFLKLSKNLKVETDLDKLKVIQDDREVEIHYVAGSSRSARLELRVRDDAQILAKLVGIPFLKKIFRAGKNEEEVVLIFSKVDGWKQNYYNYRRMLNDLFGGPYSLGRFKVRAVLDIPMMPDRYDEGEAEFVRED